MHKNFMKIPTSQAMLYFKMQYISHNGISPEHIATQTAKHLLIVTTKGRKCKRQRATFILNLKAAVSWKGLGELKRLY